MVIRVFVMIALTPNTPYYLLLMYNFEAGVDPGTVEANNDPAADIEYGYTDLAGLFDGFDGICRIFFDVLFQVGDTELVQVVFGGMTIRAPVGAINSNGGNSGCCECIHNSCNYTIIEQFTLDVQIKKRYTSRR